VSFQCEFVEQPAQLVLSIRRRTPVQELQKVLGDAYGAIGQYLGELGQAPSGAPFVVYYNMDMQDLDVEVGFPVSDPLPGKGPIAASEIPGGRFATCLYTGPYPEMAPAYEALTQLVKDNGLEATGASIESYLNDPTQTAPQALQTLIRFPLR
jgi:effector-binding domain-containing protein